MSLVIVLTLWAVVYGVNVTNSSDSSSSTSSSSLSDSIPEFRSDRDDCPSNTFFLITMIFAIFAFIVAITGVAMLLLWRLRSRKPPATRVALTKHQLVGAYKPSFGARNEDEGSAYAHAETTGFPQTGFWPLCLGVGCFLCILIMIPIVIWIYIANRELFVVHHIRRHEG
jgi:hypothetical protein